MNLEIPIELILERSKKSFEVTFSSEKFTEYEAIVIKAIRDAVVFAINEKKMVPQKITMSGSLIIEGFSQDLQVSLR